MITGNKLGCHIRACREARGFSQEYMAEMLDICQSAYANLEGGKTSLSIERLIRISTVLDVNVHELIDAGISEINQGSKSAFDHTHQLREDTKQLYEKLIGELKNEIDFLRSIIREKQAG